MKLKKVDDKTAYENLLVKYAELENKIADIKANCDFAIEGRDIKIKELEEQVANLEGIKLAQETALNTEYNIKECLIKENAELKDNLEIQKKTVVEMVMPALDRTIKQRTQAEDYIKELEQQIEKMKQDLDNARENANKQEQWEIYSVLNDIYNDNFEVITSVSN